MWRRAIIEIEEGTTGVRSRWGAITGTLPPGRHYLWLPWDRVDAVVDTSTEIPYSAPIVACPTAENVPLKSIEFFLKFRIVDPVAFVRTIGAGNFDLVLSSAVQDAIRQRSRRVNTERAYDLRGSDVGDMQELLNRQLGRYGVRITGANIPDVQLPDQYQQHLATREKVAKELSAYEREWELTRKRRIDTLLMEIERSKKTRDARIVEVKAAAQHGAQGRRAHAGGARDRGPAGALGDRGPRPRRAHLGRERGQGAAHGWPTPTATTGPCCSTSWPAGASTWAPNWRRTPPSRSSSAPSRASGDLRAVHPAPGPVAAPASRAISNGDKTPGS